MIARLMRSWEDWSTLNAMPDNPAPRRRWFRITPRTMFPVLAIFSAIGFGCGSEPSRPQLERREDVVGMSEAEARAVWGPPVKTIITKDGETVWYFDQSERAGIAFKDGKATQSNMVYYVDRAGNRYSDDGSE